MPTDILWASRRVAVVHVPWQCGKEVGIFTAGEEDLVTLKPVLEEYCEAFGMDIDEVLSVPFTKLVPVSHRPYGKLYTYV